MFSYTSIYRENWQTNIIEFTVSVIHLLLESYLCFFLVRFGTSRGAIWSTRAQLGRWVISIQTWWPPKPTSYNNLSYVYYMFSGIKMILYVLYLIWILYWTQGKGKRFEIPMFASFKFSNWSEIDKNTQQSHWRCHLPRTQAETEFIHPC